VYHVGHPEPVTIPRYFNTPTVTLKGGLVEEYLTQLAKVVNKLHLTRSVRQKDILGGIINALLPYLEKIGQPPETASAARVDLTGRKDGHWRHIALGAVGHMDLLTGLPLSIAAQMIAEGKATATGVMGPEACLPPDEFIARAIQGGIRFYQGDAMTEPLL
ncbi:MAG: saccharopine dehydrogenase family protein, partial [Candidatus Geothermincolia bacterium]